MARRRVLYGAALLAAVLFQIYSVSYLAGFLLVLAISLPLLALLLSLPAMLGCRVSLAAGQQGTARGGEAAWVVTVENRRRLPLARVTVRLLLQNRMTGAEQRRRLRISGASAPEQLAFPADTAHCGMLEGCVLRVTVCDCLGIFALPRSCTASARLPVLPVPGELPEIPELDAARAGSAPLQVRRGAGSGEDYDLRPYRPGDAVGLIHWKLSSKRDELIFREVLEARKTVPVLLLDHVGTPEQMDALLDRLDTLCRALLEQQREYAVCWLEPVSGALREHRITGRRELERCMAAVLSDAAPQAGHTLSSEPAAAGSQPGRVRVLLAAEEVAP